MTDPTPLPFNAKLIPWAFVLPNKEGQEVPFKLLPAQVEYYRRRTRRTIVHKARQLGLSYIIDADIVLDCVLHKNFRAIIIAHEKEATKKLFGRCRRLIKNWQLDDPPRLIGNSKTTLEFDNGSVLYLDTAGSKASGRSDTLQRIHLSELDWYGEPDRILEAVGNAVSNSGIIEIESSARVPGGALQQMIVAANEPGAVWSNLFIPWMSDPGYVVDWDKRWVKTEEEIAMQLAHQMSDRQLAWRRNKIKEMKGNVAAFRREFPATSDEAFKSGLGRGAFSAEALHRYSKLGTPPFRRGDLTYAHGEPQFTLDEDGWLHLWQEPQRGHSYVIGADPGGGGESSDNSVAHVMDCSTGAVVAKVRGLIPPDRLAVILDCLGSWYNRAWICPEVNNHGLAVILALRDQRKYPRIQPRTVLSPRQEPMESGALGWLTTALTKPLLITQLDRVLRDGLLPYIPKDTLGELFSYQTTAFGYAAPAGLHDDEVLSLAITVDTFLRHRAPIVLGGRPIGGDPVGGVSLPPNAPSQTGY